MYDWERSFPAAFERFIIDVAVNFLFQLIFGFPLF